jgi:hypothetical protein
MESILSAQKDCVVDNYIVIKTQLKNFDKKITDCLKVSIGKYEQIKVLMRDVTSHYPHITSYLLCPNGSCVVRQNLYSEIGAITKNEKEQIEMINSIGRIFDVIKTTNVDQLIRTAYQIITKIRETESLLDRLYEERLIDGSDRYTDLSYFNQHIEQYEPLIQSIVLSKPTHDTLRESEQDDPLNKHFGLFDLINDRTLCNIKLLCRLFNSLIPIRRISKTKCHSVGYEEICGYTLCIVQIVTDPSHLKTKYTKSMINGYKMAAYNFLTQREQQSVHHQLVKRLHRLLEKMIMSLRDYHNQQMVDLDQADKCDSFDLLFCCDLLMISYLVPIIAEKH